MDIINKIIAKNTVFKWIYSGKYANSSENLMLKMQEFDTLEDFFIYLVVDKNMPISFLPYHYQANKSFLISLLDKKQSFINYIFENDYYLYKEIINEINLKKFIKRCKCALHPQIKRDIKNLLGAQEDIDILIAPKSPR